MFSLFVNAKTWNGAVFACTKSTKCYLEKMCGLKPAGAISTANLGIQMWVPDCVCAQIGICGALNSNVTHIGHRYVFMWECGRGIIWQMLRKMFHNRIHNQGESNHLKVLPLCKDAVPAFLWMQLTPDILIMYIQHMMFWTWKIIIRLWFTAFNLFIRHWVWLLHWVAMKLYPKYLYRIIE